MLIHVEKQKQDASFTVRFNNINLLTFMAKTVLLS